MDLKNMLSFLLIIAILSISIISIIYIINNEEIKENNLKEIKEINGNNFKEINENILNQHTNKPALVIFTASWCGACKMILPKFIVASQQLKNILFLNIEESNSGSLLNKFNVRGFPTTFLVKNGKVLDVYEGDYSIKSLSDFYHSK